jgi:hypothetical protein
MHRKKKPPSGKFSRRGFANETVSLAYPFVEPVPQGGFLCHKKA